jgi:hypothetical protein
MIKFTGRIFFASIFCLFLIIFLGFFPFPRNVKGPCRFVAQVEWSLIQIESDKVISRIVRNDSNIVKNYSLLQFNRQDFVQFSLIPGIAPGSLIEKGQTVGKLNSLENEYFLAQLDRLLKGARANLEVLKSGEKNAIQEEALRALEYAREELAAYEPQWERSSELFENNLISQEEWDSVQATRSLYDKSVRLYEAKFDVVKSGMKNESVIAMEVEIASLENQVSILKAKSSMEEIRSPINGIFANTCEESLLCQIQSIDTIIVQIAIPAEQSKYLKVGQDVKIWCSDGFYSFDTQVMSIGNQAYMVLGNPMIVALTKIKNPKNVLYQGITGTASISCGKFSLFERMVDSWKMFIHNR